MTTISASTRINAPKARVWEVLADLGGISKWNPGVARSYYTSEQTRGDGASRHCDLQPRGWLEERAFDWREGEGYTIDVYDSDLPLERNRVRFTLSENGEATTVTVTADYKLKFGPLGALLDAVYGRRQFRRGFEGLLAGLKYHVETGELVGDAVPAQAA